MLSRREGKFVLRCLYLYDLFTGTLDSSDYILSIARISSE
jgi:hypothetical protein